MKIEEKVLPVTVRTINIDGKRMTKSFLQQIQRENPTPGSKPIGRVFNVGCKHSEPAIVLWISENENMLKKCYRTLEHVKSMNIEQIFI